MDVEKTIEFLLENQARFDARMEANFIKAEERFARADERFAKAEKRMDRLEQATAQLQQVVRQTARVVGQLASASLRFRNEIRRSQIEADREIKALREHSHETDDKLNALIDLVDKSIRRNGRNNGGSNGKRGGQP